MTSSSGSHSLSATEIEYRRSFPNFIRKAKIFMGGKLIRMIKSRRMRWAGHVARMGETRNAYRILAA
jgi:hypothetical protein